MNAHAYFTLLRPVRTLIIAALWIFCATIWLCLLSGMSLADAAFLQCCIIGPVGIGSVLIAPLHEAVHRSSFPLLPGAGPQMLRPHLVATTVAALLLFAGAVHVPTIPPLGAFGLIAAGLSLPLLDSHAIRTSRLQPRPYQLAMLGTIILGMGHRTLAATCQQFPGTVFLGGLACAVLCFRIGFAPASLRARQANPFYLAPQSTLLFVGTDILMHARAQSAKLAEQHDTRSGANWDAGAIRDTKGDWRRIVRHARDGKPGWIQSEIAFFAITTAAVIATLCLVGSGRTLGTETNNDGRFLFVLAALVSYVSAMAAATSSAVPAYTFPLSRTRLAQVLFLAFERRVLTAFLGGLVGTIAGIFIVCRLHAPFELALFSRFAAVFGLVPIALNLSLAAIFLRDAFCRVTACFIVVPGFITAIGFAAMGPHAGGLVPQSLPLYAVAIGLSAWLGWLSLHSHYRRGDLTRTGDWLMKLGFSRI